MQYDSICLEEKCRIQHKQLFSSRNHEDKVHFNERHTVQLMHYGSPFFRSLTTEPIKFSESLQNARSELSAQYLRFAEQIKQVLKANFQQCQRKIRDIYELNHKEISLELLEPHLKKVTSKTEFYLRLINWKKTHPSENIQHYIQNTPKTCIKEYTRAMSSLVESLLANQPVSCKQIPQKCGQYKNKEIPQQLDDSSILLQKVLGKRSDGGYDHIFHFERRESLHKQPLKDTIKNKKEETLMLLAELFCTSQSDVRHREIQQILLKKIPKRQKYHDYLSCLMHRVCFSIENYIENKLGFRRMKSQDRARIFSDLKNYRTWMDKGDVNIFIRCFRFFTNLSKDIQINIYEIYVVYVLIIIRIIKNMNKKNLVLTYNTYPLHLKKEIIYLYMHYDDFSKVKEMLIERYPTEKKLTDQLLSHALKNIMITTYNGLKEKESIENDNFQELMKSETDFSGELWRSVMRKYIQYQIHGKVDSTEKIKLENIMKSIVSKQQSKLRDSEQIKAKDVHAIKPALGKLKESPLVIDLEEENNIPTDRFHMKNKERNGSIHQLFKTLKNQIQDSSSFSQYELDIEQKGD